MSNTPITLDLHSQVSDKRYVGLWRLMRGYRIHYAAAASSLGVAALSKTGTYLLLRYFTDQLLGETNTGILSEQAVRLLPIVGLGFIALALIEGGFTYFSGRLAAFTAEGIALRLRDYLYDHIQRLTFSYHDRTPTGDIVQRCTSDVDAVRRFFGDQAIGVGRILLLFLVNFIAIARLNLNLALFSIIIIPLILLTSIFFFRQVTKAYEKYQNQDGILTTTLQENLSGVRVVKAFARQQYEMSKFEADNSKKFQLGKKLLLMHSLFWPISDIFCGAQMLGGFGLAAWMAINGTISVGTYLAYHGLVVWLIWPMRNLGRLIVQTSTGLVSFGRVTEIIKQEREPLDTGSFQPTEDLSGNIDFRDVSFEYNQGVDVLKDISFQCKPGQVIALMGSTGSGKTSLVNLLPRFYEYTSGSIEIDGIELKDIPRGYLRQQIGIVEQEPFLFSRTIRDNITYGVSRSVDDSEIEAVARAAAIHNFVLEFPEGYDTLVGERGVTLSGGQKQRIAIARTMLKNPRILIMDDATSSVDMETEAVIRESLKKLMKGRTSFIIAHRIQSVMSADLILVLDNGRILQSGTHEELIRQKGLYRGIYDIQMKIESELESELESVKSAPASL